MRNPCFRYMSGFRWTNALTEKWKIALLILGAILFLNFFGCATTMPGRDSFEMQMVPSKGKCWRWSEIDEETAGRPLCGESRAINGYQVFCTRKMRHPRAHHMHGLKDCYWIW